MSSPGRKLAGSTYLRWALPALVVIILMFSIPAGFAGHPTALAAPKAVHPAAALSKSTSASAVKVPPFTPHPSGPTNTGIFYTQTSLAPPASSHTFCLPVTPTYSYCFPQEQEPSALYLKNGSIGLGFSILTNQTSNTCSNATNSTVIRVGFSLSTDNGTSFGPIRLLGNNTCPYIQALEPSFAVSKSGEIFGAFVEANATPSAMQGFYYEAPVVQYTTRAETGMGFVTSLDNGKTFSNATTITIAGGANIARPAVATVGKTVYVVYENISNGTTSLAGTTSVGISVLLVYSSDAGKTWHGPYNVPGEGSGMSWTAMSPSITVNKAGAVAVAYATNRQCIAFCFTSPVYGDDIVVSTSGANGTTWSGPHIVANSTRGGESISYMGFYVYSGTYLFEMSPETAIAYDPSGTKLYVAWAGAQNRSLDSSYYYEDYISTETFAAASLNGGTTWTSSAVGFGVSGDVNAYTSSEYNPGIAVSPTGTVYFTYSYFNDSYSSCGSVRSYFAPGNSQWSATSPDGVHWSSPVVVNIALNAYSYDSYQGWTSSIAFSSAGSPVIAFSSTTQGYNPFPVYLKVATFYEGSTVNLTVIETNLPGGSSWSASVDGNTFATNSNSLVVSNVPAGVTVYISPATQTGVPMGYRAVLLPTVSASEATVLSTDTTYWFNYTLFYGISFALDPLNTNYFDLYAVNNTIGINIFHYWNAYGGISTQGGCPFPWYFPVGQSMQVANGRPPAVAGGYYYGSISISSWNGTGLGSFTGGSAVGQMTVSSPWNETMWAQSSGSYNITVNAIGIPSTSTFGFKWDGTTYSGSGSTPVIVPDASTGVHRITGASATSTVSGWEYIGSLPNSGQVAVPNDPVVNLTFAYVNVGGAMGAVSFKATNLTAGTVWHFAFNGTEYASSTPWINVTTHSGTFSQVGYPVTAANSSVTYAPLGLSPTVSVTTGSTYSVNFLPAYQLSVIASQGGHVVPGNSSYWVAPGTSKTLTAVASSGFRYVGWSGTGPGSYSGPNVNATVTVNGPMVETANFVPLSVNHFNLTLLDQNTLPNGTLWTAFVNGVGYSSNTNVLNVPNLYSCAVSGSLGSYNVVVPYAYLNGSQLTRYVPHAYRAQMCGGTVQTLLFSVEYFLGLQTTTGGNATATSGTALSSTGLWEGTSSTITLQASPSNGYAFLGWNGTGSGSYTGPAVTTSITLGGPVTEVAAFGLVGPPPQVRYWVSFHTVVAFSPGTPWSLTLGGVSYSSTTSYLNVTGLLPAQYPITVANAQSTDGLTLYTPAGAPTKVQVSGNQTVPLTYRTAFWVSLQTVGGGVVVPRSGWYGQGATIVLNATSTSPYVFSSWVGTGTSAYSGTDIVHSVTISAPITEVATFVLSPPAAKVVTSTWNNPEVWAGLAVAGLVIGLATGLIVSRMRKGRSPGGEQ